MDSVPPLAPPAWPATPALLSALPGLVALETGTLTEPVPYLCEIPAHVRNAMPNVHNIPITIANILIELTSPLSATELGIEQRLGPFFF